MLQYPRGHVHKCTLYKLRLPLYCLLPHSSPFMNPAMPPALLSTRCSRDGNSTWLSARSKNSGLHGTGR